MQYLPLRGIFGSLRLPGCDKRPGGRFLLQPGGSRITTKTTNIGINMKRLLMIGLGFTVTLIAVNFILDAANLTKYVYTPYKALFGGTTTTS